MDDDIRITTDDLVAWIDRSPSNADLELCDYLVNALDNQFKYYEEIQQLREKIINQNKALSGLNVKIQQIKCKNSQFKKENKHLRRKNKHLIEDIAFCLKSIKQEKEMSIDSRTRQEMVSCYQILKELINEK